MILLPHLIHIEYFSQLCFVYPYIHLSIYLSLHLNQKMPN
nr:MAG TPA: hypothetical protein [Crassvirales sp.]